MNRIKTSGEAPRLPLTSASLADTLKQRFGEAIKRAVMTALEIDLADGPVSLDVVRQAITMALDAELLCAGVSFTIHASMSALAGTPAFRRAAERAGVRVDSLDIEQRLRIDAAFARRWREQAGERRSAAHESAPAVMADVLLNEVY